MPREDLVFLFLSVSLGNGIERRFILPKLATNQPMDDYAGRVLGDVREVWPGATYPTRLRLSGRPTRRGDLFAVVIGRRFDGVRGARHRCAETWVLRGGRHWPTSPELVPRTGWISQ
ncbi:hypothetical protein ACG83_41425 [Frankia sp. R43]|nr:hypothetical protein ACG83_41425 [Frankia sp. R43]